MEHTGVVNPYFASYAPRLPARHTAQDNEDKDVMEGRGVAAQPSVQPTVDSSASAREEDSEDEEERRPVTQKRKSKKVLNERRQRRRRDPTPSSSSESESEEERYRGRRRHVCGKKKVTRRACSPPSSEEEDEMEDMRRTYGHKRNVEEEPTDRADDIVALGKRFQSMRSVRREVGAVNDLSHGDLDLFKHVIQSILRKDIPLTPAEEKVMRPHMGLFKEYVKSRTGHSRRRAILQTGRYLKALTKLMTQLEAQ